jgi:hypothetical protein
MGCEQKNKKIRRFYPGLYSGVWGRLAWARQRRFAPFIPPRGRVTQSTIKFAIAENDSADFCFAQ